jgi:hypothetical protein
VVPAARLDPTAPTFKAFFGRSFADKRSEKGAKGKERAGKKSDEQALGEVYDHDYDSAPSSRKSRDAPSLSTLSGDTGSEPRDSLEQTTSRTPSEFGGSATAAAPRESFMQKLTRKGSTSKFNFPGLKGPGRFNNGSMKNVRGGDQDETDEEGGVGEPEKGAGSPVLTAKDKDGKSGGFRFRSLKRRKGEGKATSSGLPAEADTEEESVVGEV